METVQFSHKSVLLDEVLEGLNIQPDGLYVDGTCGGAGHSYQIAKRLTTGKLIGLDQDTTAVAVATERLSSFGEHATVVHDNFCHVASVLRELGVTSIQGMLLDLGVSSYQLDTPERGFCYQYDAPLDMRMNQDNPLTAKEIVNTYSETELANVLWNYGEEKFSRRIAGKIVEARKIKEITTTGELVALIQSAIPFSSRDAGHHPAMRSFQALRIETNKELDVIAPAIRDGVRALSKGGRMAIITFHSLEDRIVKTTFNELAQGCTCPKTLPICVCGKKPTVRLVNRKPILPSNEELSENPRSRSAKLRIIEKI